MTVVRNTIFKASAGTGKTYQVVALYNALILGEEYSATGVSEPILEMDKEGSAVDCQNILMLTFARAAAAEMRMRITERVEAALETADELQVQKYWRILRSLSGANISTIHSFSQRLLLENAVAAGISPSVRLIEDEEKDDLFKGLVRDLFIDEIGDAGSGLRSRLESMCQSRSLNDIIKTVIELIENARVRGVNLTQQNAAEYVLEIEAPTSEQLKDIFKNFEQAWQDHLAAGNKKYKTIIPFYESFKSFLDESGDDPSKIGFVAGQLKSSIKGNWYALKEVRNELTDGFDEIIGSEASLFLKDLLLFTAKCAEKYRQKKDEMGVLDYDDMILRLLQLIRSDASIVPSFEVIILDEAQDNSRIQNELIKEIQKASGASVILCGDSKQSIYTWRAADPGGMMKFAEELNDVLPIHLKVSWRSQKDLVAWINVMSKNEKVIGASYDENAALVSNPSAENTSGPNVEILLPDWEYDEDLSKQVIVPASKAPTEKYLFEVNGNDLKKLSTTDAEDAEYWATVLDQYDARAVAEARVIAKRIKMLCTDNVNPAWRPPFKCEDDSSEWQPTKSSYNYRDILILLRATAKQGMYEAALGELGIMFTTSGKGRGFYFRQEVKDISSLLTWLAYPRNDIALMAVLRSPFVSLSDTAIAILSKEIDERLRGSRLREAFVDDVEIITQNVRLLLDAKLDKDAKAYKRGVNALMKLRALAGRATGIVLIRTAIQITGFDAVLAGGFHHAQKLANMRKILSLIRETERRESMNLQSLAKWLAESVSSTKKPDAMIYDPEDDAVQISTVHSAKGLTSPVVIIPDLQRKTIAGSGWCIVHDKNDETGFLVAADIHTSNDDGIAETLVTCDYPLAKEEVKAMRAAETGRLFYVAITRPKDLLILTGESSSSNDSWRAWINTYLSEALGDTNQQKLFIRRSYSSVLEEYAKHSFEKSDIALPPSVEQLARAEQAVASSGYAEIYRFPVTVLTKVPEKPHSNDAADIEKYNKERRKYRQTGMVGLAPSWIKSRDDAEGSPPPVDYAEQGSIGHAILETFDYSSKDDVSTRIDRQLRSMGVDSTIQESLSMKLLAAVQWLMLELDAAEYIIREMPFCAKYEHDNAKCFVDGKIDLIYFKNGVWTILDYKFASSGKSDLLKGYSLQLLAYRDAISRESHASKRKILLNEGTEDAAVRMIILGIGKDNKITVAEVDHSIPSADVLRRIIESAREKITPNPISHGF